MQIVVTNIRKYDWFRAYATLDGISETIDQVSKRLRFDNQMAGAIEEVKINYEEIETVFFALIPHLLKSVEHAQIEQTWPAEKP
jgi:acyl carrier protein phosphodiesterase